jgi:putative ATP-binding cassette transporter
MPECTIISIGHRSTLAAFHKRRLVFERAGDHYQLKEGQLAPTS